MANKDWPKVVLGNIYLCDGVYDWEVVRVSKNQMQLDRHIDEVSDMLEYVGVRVMNKDEWDARCI